MARERNCLGHRSRFCFGLVADYFGGSRCHGSGSPSENAGILLGSDLGHRHCPIHDPSADVGVAAICGYRAGSGVGRGVGYVLPCECAGLWRWNFCLRNAGMANAGGRCLPVRRNHVQYCSADSADARCMARGLAPVSGGVAGNRGGAGGDNRVASNKENGLEKPCIERSRTGVPVPQDSSLELVARSSRLRESHPGAKNAPGWGTPEAFLVRV